jgi:Transposase DDE domain
MGKIKATQGGALMIPQPTRLIQLVQLLDRLPMPPVSRTRGRPKTYPDRLFLQALVIMIVRRVTTVYGLVQLLAEDTPEMKELHALMSVHGRFPCRRTWERRLHVIPMSLPGQIACLGRYLVNLFQPWSHSGRAVAIDSTMLRALGGVWHTKHREAGIVPHTSIDTEATWSKSGWHGWWYGWKLHVIGAVASGWIPLAAYLTEANVSDGEAALQLVPTLPADVRFILGDHHYQTNDLQSFCTRTGRILLCSRGNRKKLADDPGREVRRLFHKLRSLAIENWNEHFKCLFEGHSQVPTKGKHNTQRFVLGAVFVYQVILWYRFEHGLELCRGMKAFLRAA